MYLRKQRIVKRYSQAFKLKLVSEIESGRLNINQAAKLYDIKGSSTIQLWIKKFGKNHLLAKVVKIEVSGEYNKLKQLEKEKQELESALAQAQLKILKLESDIEAIEELSGFDSFKKNLNTRALKR